MARNRSPVLKRCRALGLDTAMLGYTKKQSLRGKTVPRKRSEYALQLREKQKLKFIYGVLEKQFRILYERSAKMRGMTGENMLRLLEQRLDNVVFRLGFSRTRPEARQFVKHGHIHVNGKKTDIPSYEVKLGDVISINPKSYHSAHVKEVLEYTQKYERPRWLSFDKGQMQARINELPAREDVEYPIEERLVVELYSK